MMIIIITSVHAHEQVHVSPFFGPDIPDPQQGHGLCSPAKLLLCGFVLLFSYTCSDIIYISLQAG